MGINVLPPSVNDSFHEFSIANNPDDKKVPIRFGLDAIKNVGKGAVEEILRAREDGQFTSINDFISRVSARVVNRKTWESLIKTGAMDMFGDRGSLLNSLDMILALATKIQKERLSSQVDLFSTSDDTTTALPSIQLLPPPEPIATHTQLTWERELLGLYLSHHPLDDYGAYLEEHTVPISKLTSAEDGGIATIGGTITDIRQITTKNGQNMAFVKLEDRSGEIEMVIFPGLYRDSYEVIVRDAVIQATGRISARDKNGTLSEDIKFMPDSVAKIDHEKARNHVSTGGSVHIKATSKRKRQNNTALPAETQGIKSSKLYLRIKDDTQPELLKNIKLALDDYKGSSEVVLVLGQTTKKQAVKLPFTVNIEEPLTRRLAEIVGSTNIAIQ